MTDTALVIENVPAISKSSLTPHFNRQRWGHRFKVCKHSFKMVAGVVAAVAAGYVICKNGGENPLPTISAVSGLLGSLAISFDGIENLVTMGPSAAAATTVMATQMSRTPDTAPALTTSASHASAAHTHEMVLA